MDDVTFITMHDISEDAKLMYISHSITDVLGYEPAEVVGRSIFDFFHPEQIPLARSEHGKRVKLDKAAVLAFCQLKKKTGDYIVCECVFTVVYSVVVAAISVHRSSKRNRERALKTKSISQKFDNTDIPRYNMIRHLSPKFISPATGQHEPRAALILNRFTRQLTVMYATTALETILDLPASDLVGKSFYECIQQPYLQNAVNALEKAKANDSIAYIFFTWRDPRPRAGLPAREPAGNDSDEEMQSDSDDEVLEAQNIPIEAVVSCTSDGLVVVLRRARAQYRPGMQTSFSPWESRDYDNIAQNEQNEQINYMETIRQIAAFAWCVGSLNEDIRQYAREGDYSEPGTLYVDYSPIHHPYEAGFPYNGGNAGGGNGDYIGPSANGSSGDTQMGGGHYH